MGYVIPYLIASSIFSGAVFAFVLAHLARKGTHISAATKIGAVVIAAILGPLLCPVIVFALLRGGFKVSRLLADTTSESGVYLEMDMEPIHEANLSEKLTSFVDQNDAWLQGRGYQKLGAYSLKAEPYNSSAVFYLSENRQAYLSVGITVGVACFEMVSLLEDGSCVSSASIKSFAKQQQFAEHQVFVNANDQPLDQFIASHHAAVAERTIERNSVVRVISENNWIEYPIYFNKKFGEVRHKLGELKEPPAHVEMPPAMVGQDAERDSDEEDQDSDSHLSRIGFPTGWTIPGTDLPSPTSF